LFVCRCWRSEDAVEFTGGVTEASFVSVADVTPGRALSAPVCDFGPDTLEDAESHCGGELEDRSDWYNDVELGNCFEYAYIMVTLSNRFCDNDFLSLRVWCRFLTASTACC
jgi:hypothetical protein